MNGPQQGPPPGWQPQPQGPPMYEYAVEEMRESMIGGKQSGKALQQMLNGYAQHGWQLKAITSVDVKGRVGPGGVGGLMVTFERRVR